MSIQKEKIIARLAKLMAHRDSAEELGSAEEASAFSAEIQRLLIAHKLSAGEVVVGDDGPRVGETRYKPEEWGNRTTRRQLAWQCHLACHVADAYNCGSLQARNCNQFFFIGEQSNRDCAVYVFARLIRACELLARRAYGRAYRAGADTSGFMTAFYEGFVRVVGSRLSEQARKSREDAKVQAGPGALIRLDAAKEAIADYLKNYGFAPPMGSNRKNLEGGRAGREAGRVADIRANGLEANPPQKNLAGGGE